MEESVGREIRAFLLIFSILICFFSKIPLNLQRKSYCEYETLSLIIILKKITVSKKTKALQATRVFPGNWIDCSKRNKLTIKHLCNRYSEYKGTFH